VRSLRILLANKELETWTGTIIVLRDFALKYAQRGHRPVVWAPRMGGTTVEEFERLGIEMVENLSDLDDAPDVIHGHHNISTALALAAFPGVPAIMFCHGLSWFDLPVISRRLWRHVAISRVTTDQLKRHGADPDRIVVLANAVDLSRFPLRDTPLPEKPAAAMAFTKFREHVALVREVCTRRGMTFVAMGAGGEIGSWEPERELAEQHLVFGTGRCALEAACAGAAVVVGDARGLAGMVTRRNLRALRRANFGRMALIRPITAATISAEIDKYDPEDAAEVCRLLREDADLEKATDRMEEMFAEALEAGMPRAWTEDDRQWLSRFLENWLVPPSDREEWRSAYEELSRAAERKTM